MQQAVKLLRILLYALSFLSMFSSLFQSRKKHTFEYFHESFLMSYCNFFKTKKDILIQTQHVGEIGKLDRLSRHGYGC